MHWPDDCCGEPAVRRVGVIGRRESPEPDVRGGRAAKGAAVAQPMATTAIAMVGVGGGDRGQPATLEGYRDLHLTYATKSTAIRVLPVPTSIC